MMRRFLEVMIRIATPLGSWSRVWYPRANKVGHAGLSAAQIRYETGMCRLFGRAVPVAEAAHGLDRAHVRGFAELAADVADVELHLARRAAQRAPPGEIQKLLRAQYLVGMTHEGRQQAKLRRCELHGLATCCDAALCEV